MAPRSSDGEVKDESSSDPEATEAMEASKGVALSLLGKRKAETPSPGDSGESEQSSTGEAEIDGDEDELEEDELDEDYMNQENTEPEWGYDSDARKDDTNSDKRFVEASRRFPPYLSGGVACIGDLEEPAMLGLTNREVCEKMVSLCLQRYNQDEGKNVKLDQIVDANFSLGPIPKFYITFFAREFESSHAPLVEYQAKAAWSYSHEIYPIFCRPSPRIEVIGGPKKYVGEAKQ